MITNDWNDTSSAVRILSVLRLATTLSMVMVPLRDGFVMCCFYLYVLILLYIFKYVSSGLVVVYLTMTIVFFLVAVTVEKILMHFNAF